MPKLGNFVDDSETLSRNFEVFATIIGKCQSHFNEDGELFMQQLGCCLFEFFIKSGYMFNRVLR